MTEKKYELTDEKVDIKGHTLHRIRAVRDFGYVKKGALGGWIESEKNLSHEGTCWVFGDAKVFGGAWVYGHALVSGDARVYGAARVSDDAPYPSWIKRVVATFAPIVIFCGAIYFIFFK